MRAPVSTSPARTGGSVERCGRCADGIAHRVGAAVSRTVDAVRSCVVRGEARGETGSVAAEFALLATLVAGATVGVAAVIGVSVEHPLEALTAVVDGLVGSGS